MSKSAKKAVRAAFRNAVFRRAGYACQTCDFRSSLQHAETELDAHHITNRDEMPGGGYVPENGICLCNRPGGCHEKAEAVLRGEATHPGFEPTTLYGIIGSSRLRAIAASERFL